MRRGKEEFAALEFELQGHARSLQADIEARETNLSLLNHELAEQGAALKAIQVGAATPAAVCARMAVCACVCACACVASTRVLNHELAEQGAALKAVQVGEREI